MATVMAEYGLRTCSGPFDWVVSSDFSSVLRAMESGFQSFLVYENICPDTEYPTWFVDNIYGFRFPHEGNLMDRDVYSVVEQKYRRRVQRFMDSLTLNTCFLRSIKIGYGKDLEYIIHNEAYIRSILTRWNQDSDIIFLIVGDIYVPPEFPFKHFRIWNEGIDQSSEFLKFCLQHYDMKQIARNTAFYRNKMQKLGNV